METRSKRCFWLLIMTATIGTGCVTRGRNFSSDTSWLDRNKPDQQQVKSIMGAPFKVGSTSGVRTWTYGYYKHQLFGDSHVKELKIYWDGAQKVKNYAFSSSFPTDVANKP